MYLSKITDLPKKKKKTIFSSVDREYEKTRIQYIAKAEKDLLARKIALQKLDMEHAVNRRKELEYNHFLRVKEEMKKETEIDRDNIRKLRKEYKVNILCTIAIAIDYVQMCTCIAMWPFSHWL